MAGGKHPALDDIEKARAALLARETAAVEELVSAYLSALEVLREEIAAVADLMAKTGTSTELLRQSSQFRNLIDGVLREMQSFSSEMSGNLSASILAEIEAASIDTLLFTQQTLPLLPAATVEGMFALLAPEQVYAQFGLLSEEGALFSMLQNQLPEATANYMRETMLSNFIAGENPTRIATRIAETMQSPLSWTVNTVRTANLYAYRAASIFNYRQNSHIVKGWIWISELGERTCMSCVVMHGTVHPLTQMFDDHHQGRCSPAPETLSYAELGFTGFEAESQLVPSGTEWFEGLPESTQRNMMGQSMWSAWQDGAISLEQMPRIYNDPIYGAMRREASLKGLLGDQAQIYYGS